MAKVALVAKHDVQVKVAGTLEETHAEAIYDKLAVEGFCLIEADVAEGYLKDALSDIEAVKSAGRFSQPPEQIVEGLLGMVGSTMIADLDFQDEESAAGARDGASLRYFDDRMSEFAQQVMPFLQQRLNLEVTKRTNGVLHEAGLPGDDGPELTAEACSKWLATFAHHQLMCVWCLGPEGGTLELQPFDDECNGKKLAMKPGSFVMLRADALSHRFSSLGNSYCLTCFLQKDAHTSKRKEDLDVVSPCCKALEDWAYDKIREYKELSPEEQAFTKLPRQWEVEMNHSIFTQQTIGVRTAAIHEPGTWDQNIWACAFLVAPDYHSTIPLMRFNYEDLYDENPECYLYGKSNCKHGAFIDGQELFDNTAFRISRAEASGMDVGHRMSMETGYEALVRAGYKISTIMNTRGGVYVANPPPGEWGAAEKHLQGGGVCGSGGSIACGRFSFTHGLKGPCLSCDVEAASSLITVQYACTNLSRTGNWEAIPYAVCSSWNMILAQMYLAHGTARGDLCMLGRTFSFDASTCGYARGECCISLILKAYTEMVDDEVIFNERESTLGTIAGVAVNQAGMRASITAVSGVALQEVMAEAARMADISPLDVDAVETASKGKILEDAMESSATARAFRPDGVAIGPETSMLFMQATVTSIGNQLEAHGISEILKVCLGTSWGAIHPILHLRVMNPHMDLDVCERPVNLNTDVMEFPLVSSYTGITNMSNVGTNAHCIVFGQLTEEHHRIEPAPKLVRDKILFWPEGGGSLDPEHVPRRGYEIAGTFNRWVPEPMEQVGPGTYEFTMTLGINRWERFQLCLDADNKKMLFPGPPIGGEDQGAKGALVAGPGPAFRRDSWLVDGRTYYKGLGAIGDLGEAPADELKEAASPDQGECGTKYRVRLRVRGKWRCVDWERLEAEAEAVPDQSEYQIVGSWNDGAPEDMAPDPDNPGTYFAEVQLATDGGLFQLTRNRDWEQSLYPATPQGIASSDVLGPEEQISHAWVMEGRAGDVFRVEFSRAQSEGVDEKRVSWNFVRNTPLPEAVLERLGRKQYSICGTWDNMQFNHKMYFTGEYYQFYIELGEGAKESFWVMEDGFQHKLLWPSVKDATPHERHELEGPGPFTAGRMWAVGHHRQDQAEKGSRYEVRLFFDDEENVAIKLDWMPVKSVEGLEDARGRGFFVFGT